jgi:glutamate formiminotransferase
MDEDHNRSVITFAGHPDTIVEAAVRGVEKAVELINLNRHLGVHPRVGAADVVPFVPVQGITLAECARLAETAGAEIWRRVRVPVYLYEAAARRPERKRLENIRRGQFEYLRDAAATDPERQPDIGGPEFHPTAGAVVMGARKLLIAWNVNLTTADVNIAKAIARKIRASSGGFAHVKALGLMLESRKQAQVSMNLTDFDITPMHTVFEAIRREAWHHGTDVAESEVIGLIPRAAIERAGASYLKIGGFAPNMLLENRIAELLPDQTVDGFLQRLTNPSEPAGCGSAAAISGAMAAALGLRICLVEKQSETQFEEHRRFFSEAASRDERAYGALLHGSPPSQQSLSEATAVPLEIAERAMLLMAALRRLQLSSSPRFACDIESALAIAESARLSGIATARANLSLLTQPDDRKSFENRLLALE